MSNFLDLASEKFYLNKGVTWDLSLEDFICECYLKLNPCSYGNRVAEKIRRNLYGYKVDARLGQGDMFLNGAYYEQKVSYLSNVNYSWSLTHLRPWQKFGYYILCLVDCEDDFNPNFFVIDKMAINKLKLSAMNGTSEANHNNSNIELRTNVMKDSTSHRILEKMNLLEDNSFEALQKFVKNR